MQEGLKMAEREGMLFTETSALDSSNVNEAFELVVKGWPPCSPFLSSAWSSFESDASFVNDVMNVSKQGRIFMF